MSMLVKGKWIDFNTAFEEYTLSQDTINTVALNQAQQDTTQNKQDTIGSSSTTKIPLGTIRQIDLSQVDSILRRSEEREKQIELERQQKAARLIYYRRPKDTTEILYKQFGIASFPIEENLNQDPFQHNFLYNYSSIKPVAEKTSEQVFIESNKKETVYKNETRTQSKIEPRYIQNRFHFDWITIVLAVSLLLLGWVRLFNKKYLLSLVKSVISYQESNTLYREKNSLMERASFIINLLFISNVSVFTLQAKNYFGIHVGDYPDYIFYLIVFASVLALYIFRGISSGLIGYLFLKKQVYSEYFHNVNIYTKNTGLILFPIVIAIQFITFNYLYLLVYAAIIAIVILYFLLYIRAFQIIIRKNVSIFYMILYLCAFEISPFLIVYKLLLSLG